MLEGVLLYCFFWIESVCVCVCASVLARDSGSGLGLAFRGHFWFRAWSFRTGGLRACRVVYGFRAWSFRIAGFRVRGVLLLLKSLG